MDDTTAPCAEKADCLAGIPPMERAFSRAQVMARIAQVMAMGSQYAPGGRGPLQGFDGFGFVRYCASVASFWNPGLGFEPPGNAVNRPLNDLRDYMGWPEHEPSCEAVCAAVESWGMERIERGHPLKTQPGDIIITQGHGPDCCIVTDSGNHDRGELVAMVWAPKGAEIRPNTAFGRVAVRAYRWPSAAATARG